MSKGLLVSYARPRDVSSFFPDNGLASLAGALLAAKHDVKILDLTGIVTFEGISDPSLSKDLLELSSRVFEKSAVSESTHEAFIALEKRIRANEESFIDQWTDRLKEMVRAEQIEWIGFKLWLGVGIKYSARIAIALKRTFPALKIFGGGPVVDVIGKAVLDQYPIFDCLCWADGEEAIVSLADHVDGMIALSSIKSIIYRDSNSEVVQNDIQRVEDLDRLPLPCYAPDVYLNIDDRMKIFSISDGRGCPVGCAFCLDPNKYHQRKVERSPQSCFEEMCILTEEHSAMAFRFSCSNTSLRFLEKLAETIIAQKRRFVFSLFSNTYGLNPQRVDLLKQAGLFGIFIGIESASEEVLQQDFNKKLNLDRLRENIHLLRENDIFVTFSWIYPDLKARPDTLQRNMDFINRTVQGYEKTSQLVYFPALYPSSTWYRESDRYGFTFGESPKNDYVYELLNYEWNIVLPTSIWRPLSYKNNNRTFHQLTAETCKMSAWFKEQGYITDLPEANFLPAFIMNCPDYKQYARWIKRTLFSFSSSDMRRLIAAVNQGKHGFSFFS